jgi:hypothetical protein
MTWIPDIPGNFTVTASFPGSESYYPSHDDTSFTVSSAAPTASPGATAAPSMTDQYFVPSVIGILVAIIIVGVVLAAIMLRKRP